MKRLVLIALAACVATSALAQTATKKKNTGLIGSAVEKNGEGGQYGMAGCGLGSVLFGETDSRLGQLLAGTTNSVYSNNTFGMSSGTSNCVPESASTTAAVKKNVDLFVAANREALANDIVQRDGETIVALSNIMGCSDNRYLGTRLQSKYETIFKQNTEQAVADNMFDVVMSDRYLVENCQL